jgi:hypothetical protein
LVACGEVQWKCRLLSFGRDANKPRASVGTSARTSWCPKPAFYYYYCTDK